MNKYRVVTPVFLHTGSIGLTVDQARPRAGCLAQVGDGEYEIMGTVCFKAGEIIGLADPDKATLSRVEAAVGDEPDAEMVVQKKGRSRR